MGPAYCVVAEFTNYSESEDVADLEEAKSIAQNYVIKTSAHRAAVLLKLTDEVIVAYTKQEVD